jgi:hypothetical protein
VKGYVGYLQKNYKNGTPLILKSNVNNNVENNYSDVVRTTQSFYSYDAFI